MPKKKAADEPGVPEWVVTYGDLMSLLLCFFILLAAFSELKQPREFRKILEHIKEALGIQGGMGQVDIPDSTTNSTLSLLEEQAKRGEDAQFVNKQNEDNVVGRHDKVSVVHEGDYFAKGGTTTFGAGEVEISEEGRRQLLEQVAPEIRGRQNVVRIVGHAWGYEDAAAGSKEDPDRDGIMLMAFLRAQAVENVLVREGGVDPRILRIETAGDREPVELPSYGATAGTQNRRVQVYLTDRTIGEVHPDPLGTGRGN
ncbi:MAG: flagellar motor protein MotB [Planctomycetota bacterium]